jgi:hypothetical protein
MTAEGLSESATGGLQYYQWGIEVPGKLYPLSWDQRHTIKLIGMADLPFDVKLSLSWLFHSGKPFTFYPSRTGFAPLDPSQEFEPNNARMNQYNLVNIKVLRSFTFGIQEPALRLTIFVDVRNLLNSKNVRWVDSSGKVGGELEDVTAYDLYRRTNIGVRIEL